VPPRPRTGTGAREAADALARVAPLASRWIERLLASHEPPLSTGQYLALEAVSEGEVVGAELARRSAVSPAAVSQLLTSLERSGYVVRLRSADDRRRQHLVLTPDGERVLGSAREAVRAPLAAVLVGLPAVGNGVTQALPAALAAFDAPD